MSNKHTVNLLLCKLFIRSMYVNRIATVCLSRYSNLHGNETTDRSATDQSRDSPGERKVHGKSEKMPI
jgi:hypothetical protein